jgi:beta-glucanase (GH16 family)
MLIPIVCLLLASFTHAHPTDGLERIFYEPFDSPSLNTSVWNYGYPWGSYHNHRANTIPRQVKVTPEGYLNITATRERSINLGIFTDSGPIDLDFTSGAVNTNGKFCIKNGYVEVSLRASDVQSTWPSVFLIGEDQTTVPMITIMEVFDSRSCFTYGFRYANQQGTAEEVSYTADNRQTSNDLHRYGVDWGYDQITWYYDDTWVNTIIKSDELKQVDNMCLVIGFGVGGKSKETPIDPRAYPTIMSLDWIEMWQPKYDGFYKFENVHTGFLMEVGGSSQAERAPVLQWPDNDSDTQVS